MATMEHVIKIGHIVVTIDAPVKGGYAISFYGEQGRLIIDGKGSGRVIERNLITGRMNSIAVRF